MYQFLKNRIQCILPKRLLKRFEPAIRNGIYQFYKGKKYRCNICDAHLKSFIELPNKDLLCPRCASLPRTRRLFEILNNENLLQGTVLHFSPPLSLYQQLKQITDIQYISSDFENEFLADKTYDLTNITTDDSTFDLFIAYHVLEHIEADIQAMQELFRVTKKGGKGLIQTPFKSGAIYEDFSIKTPSERLAHFGQADHVRVYSVDGLVERLVSVGFEVEVLTFSEDAGNYYGYKMTETVLLVGR